MRPWSGVSAVSPSTYLILSTPMPSSSAAICGMAMRRPWPRSTLPQNTVTVPSALTARKASTSLGSRRAARAARLAREHGRRRAGQRKADGERAALEHRAAGEAGVLSWAFMSASLSRCRHAPRARRAHACRSGRDCRRAPTRMSSSLGFGFSRSRAAALMIMPLVQ